MVKERPRLVGRVSSAITAALRELPADFVLEGEAVAYCSGAMASGRPGERMFRHACASAWRASKRLDKPYSSGRCHPWRKVKNPAFRDRRNSISW